MKLKSLQIMDRIPNLIGALKDCEVIAARIQALAAESAAEVKKLSELSVQISRFFALGETPAVKTATTTAAAAGISAPADLDPKKLPAVPPKKYYEIAAAIISAAKTKDGLTFSQIEDSWRSLKWKGADKDTFVEIIRAALKTGRRIGKITHTGGRNGKYRLP